MAASSDQPAVSIPSWWAEAADSIAYDSSADPPPVVVVCGPGNSGKSLFSRVALNALLNRYKRVGYLDTDVGQPEFTAPGCLSLHVFDKPMPDLTILCLKTPERFFFYGDVNCQKNKDVYLSNILCLYDYFHKEYYLPTGIDNSARNMMPLVVNTSGWVKGAGYDMLVKMLRHVSPTHVVQIHVPAECKNLPRGKFWLDGNQQDSINLIETCALEKELSTGPAQARKDAHTLRDLRIIAYFRQCLPRELYVTSYKNLVQNLASVPTSEVALSKIKVIQLHSLIGDNISHSLNASIVGLGISSCIPGSCENSTPWCIGLGFVRAVDDSKGLLYIITHIPVKSLEKVDIILQGSLEVPSCLLQVAS